MAKECYHISELEDYRGESGGFSAFMSGILFGGLIGAAAVMLAAPRSGTETRQMIREKSIELRDRAKEVAEEARWRAQDLASHGSGRAAEITEQGSEILNEQKATIQSVVEGVKEGVRTYVELNQAEEQEDMPGVQPVGTHSNEPE